MAAFQPVKDKLLTVASHNSAAAPILDDLESDSSEGRSTRLFNVHVC